MLCNLAVTALLLYYLQPICGINEDQVKKLESAMVVVTKAIEVIDAEWSVHQYPLFLKSCSMHKSAWDMMKYKYSQRILSQFTKNTRVSFVISFLGRCVAFLQTVIYAFYS